MELVLAVLFVIFLVAALLSWVTEIDIAFLFAPSIFFITLWEFIFGLNGILTFGMEALVLFATGTTLILLISSVKFRASILKSIYSPSSTAFFLLATISFLKSKDWVLSLWDEFTHWGHVAKIVYEYGALGPGTPTEYTAENYPPALSLFQYFVMEFSSGWREGLLFWSLQLIAISILVSVLAKCSYRHFSEIVLKLFVALIASFTFFNYFDNVYSDATLAITFGFLILIAIVASFLDGRWILIFATSAAFITLIKPIGIYFALSAILINLAATIFALKSVSVRNVIVSFRPALISLGAVATVWMAWGYYLSSSSSSSFSLDSYVPPKFNQVGSEQYGADITSIFIDALFHINLNPSSLFPMPASIWTVTCIGFFAVWVYLNGKINVRKNFAIGLTLLITTAGYMAVILNSYLTIFVSNEASGLASFQRYIATWYQGVFFMTVLLLVSEFNFEKDFQSNLASNPNLKLPNSKRRSGVLLLTFIFLTSLSSIGNYVYLIRSPQYSGSVTREPFAPMIKAIREAEIPEGSKVYIITQHKVGFEYYILRYEMIGAQFGYNAFSIGSPNGESGDAWTDQTMDVEKWSATLRDYDFVVLYIATESFIKEFSPLFERGVVETNNVYKIEKFANTVVLSKLIQRGDVESNMSAGMLSQIMFTKVRN